MEPEIVDWLGDGPESREAVDTPGVSRIHDPRPPLLGVVAAPEVRADATVRVRSIATAFNTLNSIVRRHERTIQKRWGKKTRQQRVKILIAAWPNMARGHRPEFQAYLEERTLQNFEYREHYIWPYINQEDLGGPRPLLILLNARARHPPSMFAGADLGAMHIGILLGAITPVTLKDEDYAMVLHGVTRSVDYGRLQALKTPIDYSKWVKSGKQFLPGHGLLILHDIPRDSLTTGFPILPEPQLPIDTDDTGFKALSVMAATAPYRVPGEIDFDCMESLLAAKVSAIEDHIWSLREDPGYFVEQLLDTKDHRMEMVEDIHGRPGPLCRRGNENKLWRAVQTNVILLPFIELELFGDLHQQVKVLRALRTKNSDNISPGKALPEGYLMALLNFRGALLCSATAVICYFGETTAPAMRKYLVRVPGSRGLGEDDAEARIKPDLVKTDPEGRLFEMFDMLFKMSDDLDAVSLALAVDELDRLIQAEPRARALMSTKFASLITDLSIVTQCLGQLSLYQPWASCFEHNARERSKTVHMGCTARTMALFQISASLYDGITTQIVELGTPTGGRFTYPAKKRRTKETVTTMRLAERSLDAFWAAADRVLYSCGEAMRSTRAGKLLTQPRILQRTPPWVEPEVSLTGPTPMTGADMLVKPFSELFFRMSETSSEKENTPAREKVKTRGTPLRSNDHATIEPTGSPKEEPQLPSPPRPLAVDARALKVFRTLFFSPDATTTPGEVSWNDFLHAMSSAGFSIRKLYGSAWQFAPVETGAVAARPIQFHEPHPKGKLRFLVARNYGRRLGRAYGWYGGMFVLKGKMD